MSGKSQSFGQVFLECIDEGLSVLGDEPRLAVYQYLSTICSLPRDDIPERVEDFAVGLKKGLRGASKVIERLILRKLFQRLGSTFREAPDLDFIDYVEEAKRRFEIFSQKHGFPGDTTETIRSKKGQVAS